MPESFSKKLANSRLVDPNFDGMKELEIWYSLKTYSYFNVNRPPIIIRFDNKFTNEEIVEFLKKGKKPKLIDNTSAS